MKKSNFREILNMKEVEKKADETINDKSELDKKSLNSYKSQPNLIKELSGIKKKKLSRIKSENIIIPIISKSIFIKYTIKEFTRIPCS